MDRELMAAVSAGAALVLGLSVRPTADSADDVTLAGVSFCGTNSPAHNDCGA